MYLWFRCVVVKCFDMKNILPSEFYQQSSVVEVAQQLLGKYVYTYVEQIWRGGIIVETEAYCGATDRACHAYPDKRTKRTETMYQAGGIAYMYLCYGIHTMFNIVSNVENKADAILIRAIEPTTGIATMLQDRNIKKLERRLTAGPGCLTKALGMTLQMDRVSLQGPHIWISSQCKETATLSKTYQKKEVICSPRVGIDYAGKDALLPWRFRVKDSKWTSPAK